MTCLALLGLTPSAAGPEAAVETIPCPNGSVLIGFTGWQGRWMEGIEGHCARIGADGRIDPAAPVSTARAGGIGHAAQTTSRTVLCGGRKVVTGFAGEKDRHVWDIHAIQCTDFEPARRVAAGAPVWRPAFSHRSQGRALAQFCLDGRVAFGMTVETGSGALDHFNLSCGFAPGAGEP